MWWSCRRATRTVVKWRSPLLARLDAWVERARGKSLFAPPLNCKYRIFNASGQKPARLANGNDLRIMMNIMNNEAFFFDNPYLIPEPSL